MSGTTEAFARVKIDALLEDAGWNLTDGSSVLFEHTLPDGTQADYVLRDRQGRSMAALEAKHASSDPGAGPGTALRRTAACPFAFLSNGEEAQEPSGDSAGISRQLRFRRSLLDAPTRVSHASRQRQPLCS